MDVDRETRATLQSIEARLSTWLYEGELIKRQLRVLLTVEYEVPKVILFRGKEIRVGGTDL